MVFSSVQLLLESTSLKPTNKFWDEIGKKKFLFWEFFYFFEQNPWNSGKGFSSKLFRLSEWETKLPVSFELTRECFPYLLTFFPEF